MGSIMVIIYFVCISVNKNFIKNDDIDDNPPLKVYRIYYFII